MGRGPTERKRRVRIGRVVPKAEEGGSLISQEGWPRWPRRVGAGEIEEGVTRVRMEVRWKGCLCGGDPGTEHSLSLGRRTPEIGILTQQRAPRL